MYRIYILRSQKTGRYYIGQTNNLAARLERHNSGKVRSTKHGIPWSIVLTEGYDLRSQAMQREAELKSFKSGIKFKKLIDQANLSDEGEVA